MSSRHEVCSRHYPLRQRLRLMNSTVTAVVLYGSCAWIMTRGSERKLRTTQRRMLRWMVGVRRLAREDSDSSSSQGEYNFDQSETEDSADDAGETWIEWIQRSTYIAEEHLARAKLDDWVTEQRRRLFRWAGHAARRTDNRWSTRVLDWQPTDGKRLIGRPKRRWSDTLNDYFLTEHGLEKGSWQALAQCRETWSALDDDFCKMSA